MQVELLMRNTIIAYHRCLFVGVSAPGSDPELRGPPPGAAEVFQPVSKHGAEPTGERLRLIACNSSFVFASIFTPASRCSWCLHVSGVRIDQQEALIREE